MAQKSFRGEGGGRAWRERIGVFAPAILLSIAALALAYHFVQPAPPRHIVIATGSEDGAYYAYGQRYRRLLAREGVDATLRVTSGSTENIRLVQSGEADIAFVQGGTGSSADAPTLRSLASLYYEPVWIFVRKDPAIKRLGDLRGRRIAIDREGSGTRPIALALLADNGIGPETASLSPLGGLDALAALRARELDAAFFVIAPGAAVVHDGFAAANIRLLGLGRGPAYVLHHRFLSALVLPEGEIDLKADLPPRDIVLLAPAATLVAGEDFHPALTELILTIARRIHGGAGVFEQAGDFPSRRYLDFPLSDAAERFFDSGPPLLQRYLPFWAANLVDRLKILLLPLITLIYPLFKLVPPTYDWRMRSRINRWYRELQAIERRLEAGPGVDPARQFAELDRLEKTVGRLSVPVAYGNALYSLRSHIVLLRDELRRSSGPGEARRSE
jgi:uncharacterized protein